MKIRIRNYQKFEQAYLKAGFSCRGLAKSAGISPATLHRNIHAQNRYFSPITAKKICDALGVEFDDIFEIVPAERRRAKKSSTVQ